MEIQNYINEYNISGTIFVEKTDMLKTWIIDEEHWWCNDGEICLTNNTERRVFAFSDFNQFLENGNYLMFSEVSICILRRD
jgi:hypothetical protein